MRLFSLALIACLFLVACTTAPAQQQSGIVGNVAVQQEIARLAVLVNGKNATETDFTNLAALVAGDEYATDELGEITTMVHYQEYVHASHGLGFLDSYVQTGKQSICPGHELSHYYVFTRHGEDERAADALASAREDLPIWEPKAQAYAAQYPTVQSFAAMDTTIKAHLDTIANGTTTATDDEITTLADMLCVDE